MARNEEKALTLFSKWTTFKQDFHASAGNRRPLLASDCDSLADADKWRRDLVRDVTKKISAIHNASLGEHRIRELNDEINKMMRQKHYWETRIRELGGETGKSRQFYDVEGKELPGAPGYKYYGAAKDLPGVRELFAEKDDEAELRRQKRSRADLFRHITPDYYGYRDDDDGVLALKEHVREEKLRREADVTRAEKREALREVSGVAGEDGHSSSSEEEEDEGQFGAPHVQGLKGVDSVGRGVVPTQQQLDAWLMEQKKKALLERMQLL